MRCEVGLEQLGAEEGGKLQVGPNLGRDVVQGSLGVERSADLCD